MLKLRERQRIIDEKEAVKRLYVQNQGLFDVTDDKGPNDNGSKRMVAPHQYVQEVG